ncbi:MAG: HRDC domain-containing protein, partial [Bacilli bacterium]|nr:HRDC domain-containing protein [Bacilli bacterium]
FIRELIVNGRKVKKGMYSPLRQVEAQREVVRKCSMKNQTMFDKIRDNLFNTKDSYYDYRRVLVVAANPETILNTSKAPKDIKNKVIRADALIRTIENDIRESKEEFPLKEKDMKLIAENYLETEQSSTDYYEFYKNKFNLEQQIKIEQPNKETPQVEIEILEEDNPNDIELKNRLKELRTKISKEQIIPAYYVYNNEELDRIVERKPKTIEELREVLPAVKVNSHGKKIIEELTK